ncbi:MAG: glycosyltransferase family 4 protein [Bacteroidales bacterium]|nr:glycosyltransferase family 4 protein [Bacteroidales bacterium]
MISYPDVRLNNSSLHSDIATEFQANGHTVYVAAPSIGEEVDSLHMEGNVHVLRVKTNKLFNVNPIKKGIANLRLPYQFKKALKKHVKDLDFDLVLTPTPPITFSSLVYWFKKRYNAKYYLILRDIFPQNAKDLGLIKNNLLFNFFRKKEKQLYKIADAIGCMSQGNIDFVIQHNPQVDKKKLHLLPNWETPKPYVAPTGQMKEKYGLQNKFVAVFGGNIGLPQQLEFVLELAERKKDNKNIVFLIIGDGTERKRVENLAKGKGLDNVVFKNAIPREDYNELVKECEIGLICLNEKFTIPNIPSKTLSYFNAKIPVLAAVDKSTDYGKILEDAQAGLWSITGDGEAYERNFDKLYQDENFRKGLGDNGHQYFLDHLTTNQAYKTILQNMNL